MKRIIFLNRFYSPDFSATSILLTDLVVFLKNDWHIVVITSRQLYDNPHARLPMEEKNGNLTVFRVRTSCFGRQNIFGRMVDYLTFYINATWKLSQVIWKNDIVVVKTDPPMISILVAVIVRAKQAKYINWLQDIFPEVASILKIRRGFIFSFLKFFRNKSLQYADMNVVLSEGMGRYIKTQHVPEERIEVIYNWADRSKIKLGEQKPDILRKKWNMQSYFIVGYSGNFGRAHEFATIMGAAELLLEHPHILFLFIGDGAQKSWLQEQKETRKLSNVRFKPYQPRDILSSSLKVPDVHLVCLHPPLENFIVPSKFYGIAAAGRPVLYVGDEEGEIAVRIKKESCGFAVRPGNDRKLAEMILRLATNPTLCDAMGKNAHKMFEKYFEKSIALAKWKKILDKTFAM